MNWARVRGWFIDMMRPEYADPLPPLGDKNGVPQRLQRPQYPCGVTSCFEPQTIVSQDERDTTVACATHHCLTTWHTTAREAREQNIIRVQDGWAQHATRGPRR